MAEVANNFIDEMIREDLDNGIYTHVHTRFPPEPNLPGWYSPSLKSYLNVVSALDNSGL